ncbi:hypothetical protein K438DRAFT_1753827 [Mycena galopus ATCC 62051]|nr:hypothetical protein K438DRAFT_1753827 [Mycena galopus ATCC 62051]
MAFDTEFESAQEQIFKVIGCKDIARKPQLSYKLTLCSKTILFGNEDSWASLLNGVASKFKGKKLHQIEICIASDYLEALVKHRSKKSSTQKRPGWPSARNIIDLDHASGDEQDDDTMGEGAYTMEDKNTEYDRLERKYRGKCELCNKANADAWCKIDKDGKHTQQKHGVTYDVPPNTDSFVPFHIKATAPRLVTSLLTMSKNRGEHFAHVFNDLIALMYWFLTRRKRVEGAWGITYRAGILSFNWVRSCPRSAALKQAENPVESRAFEDQPGPLMTDNTGAGAVPSTLKFFQILLTAAQTPRAAIESTMQDPEPVLVTTIQLARRAVDAITSRELRGILDQQDYARTY